MGWVTAYMVAFLCGAAVALKRCRNQCCCLNEWPMGAILRFNGGFRLNKLRLSWYSQGQLQRCISSGNVIGSLMNTHGLGDNSPTPITVPIYWPVRESRGRAVSFIAGPPHYLPNHTSILMHFIFRHFYHSVCGLHNCRKARLMHFAEFLSNFDQRMSTSRLSTR